MSHSSSSSSKGGFNHRPATALNAAAAAVGIGALAGPVPLIGAIAVELTDVGGHSSTGASLTS